MVEKLKALLENPVDDTQAEVRKLTEEYNSIGHVPYKEKDKIFNEYHEVLDKIFKELKKGNSLIDEMNRKVQKLKDDLELIKQKIKAIDSEEK